MQWDLWPFSKCFQSLFSSPANDCSTFQGNDGSQHWSQHLIYKKAIFWWLVKKSHMKFQHFTIHSANNFQRNPILIPGKNTGCKNSLNSLCHGFHKMLEDVDNISCENKSGDESNMMNIVWYDILLFFIYLFALL